MDAQDFVAMARGIVDANLYMTLGTADGTGAPWASPVYFAHVDYREFLWVSRPDARHSVNLAARPQLSIVIFDSSVAIGTGTGVYMTASAEQLPEDDAETLARVIEPYSRRAQSHGGSVWGPQRVDGAARHRLYRATATEHWVLDVTDERIPVQP